MKLLLFIILVAFSAYIAQELKLGRVNQQQINKDGTYFIELKQELQRPNELHIGAFVKLEKNCVAYISHESHSKNPGPSKYQHRIIFSTRPHPESNPYVHASINFNEYGKMGRYYISFKDIQHDSKVLFLARVIKKVEAIKHNEIFRSEAGDLNFGIGIVKTKFNIHNSLNMKVFYVELNATNPPKNAFINKQPIKNGLQKIYFEFRQFYHETEAIMEIEGDKLFRYSIKIKYSHAKISNLLKASGRYYSQKNEYQYYVLDRKSDDLYEDIYIEAAKNVSFDAFINYIPKNAVIPFQFPTREMYEFKSIKIIRDSDFWCSFVKVPKKPGFDIGISVNSIDGFNADYLVSLHRKFIYDPEVIRIDRIFIGEVLVSNTPVMNYRLSVEFLDKQFINFRYQLPGENRVHEIGSFDKDFKLNVRIERREMNGSSAKIMIKSDFPTFIKFSWERIWEN